MTLFSISTFLVMLCSSASISANGYGLTPHISGYSAKNLKAGQTVGINANYTAPGTANVRLRLKLVRPDGLVLAQKTITKRGTGGSSSNYIIGSAYFSLTVPSAASGNTNRWVTEVFTYSWQRRHTYNGPSNVSISSNGVNRIYNLYPPTKFTAGNTVTVPFRTEKNSSGKVWYQVRLFSSTGQKLVEKTVSSYSTKNVWSIRVSIPSWLSTRSDYKWNVQMYNSNWSKKLASVTKSGITIYRKKSLLSEEFEVVESLLVNDLTVSPNPFDNSFKYEYKVENEQAISVGLYGLDGQKVKEIKTMENHSAGIYVNVIDTSDLESGMYILRINSSEGNKTMKLFKQ